MTLDDYRTHPQLVKFIKKVPSGEYLFKQGQLGKTMFVVLDGAVELIAEWEDDEHVEALLGAGQFLGEKAMMGKTPHQRLFGARTKRETTVLEIGLAEVEQIENTDPQLMNDILKRAFQIAADRLAKANYLIRVLRSSDNRARLIHCISFFWRTSGKLAPEGREVEIAVDSIHHYIDMDKEEIARCLEVLVAERLLSKVDGDLYRVLDENGLLAYAQRGEFPTLVLA